MEKGEAKPIPSTQGPAPEDLRRLLTALPGSVFRFLTAEYAEDYAAIAYVLHWNRQYGLNEIQHDDLRRDAEALVGAMTGRGLDEERFQPMVDNLYAWGVVDRRLATVSIRSIRDWRRNYTQYWITDDAYRLFELLEHGQGLRTRQLSGAEGRDYVRLLDERLAALGRDLEAIPPAATEQEVEARHETLRQLYHALTLLHTNEFRQFKDFLTNLNTALIEFGRRPAVDMRELPQVRTWLESYVRDMLLFFRERSDRIVQSARSIRDSPKAPLLQVGHQLAVDAATTPFGRPTSASHPPPDLTLLSFMQFFERRQGLDQQARRIKESVAETTRRLEEHFQRLAETSQVLDLLRLRTTEILAIDPGNEARQRDADDWLARLFAPKPVRFAPRIGTSETQGRPPLPGRYHENRRPPVRDAVVRRAAGSAEGATRVDEERAVRINEFVETRILRGRDEADLRATGLETLEDFRTLLAAVKYDRLHLASPISRSFAFTVHDPRGAPADPLLILRWDATSHAFTGPNLVIRRKVRQPVHGSGMGRA